LRAAADRENGTALFAEGENHATARVFPAGAIEANIVSLEDLVKRRLTLSHDKQNPARRILGSLPLTKGLWHNYKHWRYRAMRKQFISVFGLVVQNGPFKGIKYLPESANSSLLPKLVGSYEAALHPTIESLAPHRYDSVINIGCAEGYYAVGLARRWPGVRVIAFDSDPRAREMCAKLAVLNQVSNQITILGECNPQALAASIRSRSLIVCDCEGYEAKLLDPDLVEGLDRCGILVELHPTIDSTIPGLIEKRFRKSHQTVLIRGKNGRLGYRELKVFKWFDRKLAMHEERGGYEALWAMLTPEAGGEGAPEPASSGKPVDRP
jgi:hypothetical protein